MGARAHADDDLFLKQLVGTRSPLCSAHLAHPTSLCAKSLSIARDHLFGEVAQVAPRRRYGGQQRDFPQAHRLALTQRLNDRIGGPDQAARGADEILGDEATLLRGEEGAMA